MPRDALLSLSKALPNAGNNATDGIDLSLLAGNNAAWRTGYFLVTVPALANNSDTSKTTYLRLQVAPPSYVGSTYPPAAGSYADSVPLIECDIVGVTTTGSAAKTFKVPLPPGTYGWIRFYQLSPTGIDNSASTVTYEWTIGEVE